MTRTGLFLLGTLALVACGSSGGDDGLSEAPPAKPAVSSDIAVVSLPLVTDGSELGKVSGVAEVGSSFVAFGDRGIAQITGGTVVARVDAPKGWISAASLPAADGTGTWATGLASDGRLLRLLDGGGLEDVGPRYGLSAGEKPSAVVAMDAATAVIALDAELVVADVTTGKTKRFPTGKLGALSAHAPLVAGVTGDSVVVLDTSTGKLATRVLSGARATAFDVDARLLALTDHALMREAGPGFEPIFERADVTLRGLAGTPIRAWIVAGSELWALDAGGLHRATGASIDEGATAGGSPSGDAWTFGSKLGRFHVDAVTDEDVWRETALPVFQRVCKECHAPKGAAGIDLSTHDAWASRKELLKQRVLDKRDMPPKPRSLTPEETKAIETYVSRR